MSSHGFGVVVFRHAKVDRVREFKIRFGEEFSFEGWTIRLSSDGMIADIALLGSRICILSPGEERSVSRNGRIRYFLSDKDPQEAGLQEVAA